MQALKQQLHIPPGSQQNKKMGQLQIKIKLMYFDQGLAQKQFNCQLYIWGQQKPIVMRNIRNQLSQEYQTTMNVHTNLKQLTQYFYDMELLTIQCYRKIKHPILAYSYIHLRRFFINGLMSNFTQVFPLLNAKKSKIGQLKCQFQLSMLPIQIINQIIKSQYSSNLSKHLNNSQKQSIKFTSNKQSDKSSIDFNPSEVIIDGEKQVKPIKIIKKQNYIDQYASLLKRPQHSDLSNIRKKYGKNYPCIELLKLRSDQVLILEKIQPQQSLIMNESKSIRIYLLKMQRMFGKLSSNKLQLTYLKNDQIRMINSIDMGDKSTNMIYLHDWHPQDKIKWQNQQASALQTLGKMIGKQKIQLKNKDSGKRSIQIQYKIVQDNKQTQQQNINPPIASQHVYVHVTQTGKNKNGLSFVIKGNQFQNMRGKKIIYSSKNINKFNTVGIQVYRKGQFITKYQININRSVYKEQYYQLDHISVIKVTSAYGTLEQIISLTSRQSQSTSTIKQSIKSIHQSQINNNQYDTLNLLIQQYTTLYQCQNSQCLQLVTSMLQNHHQKLIKKFAAMTNINAQELIHVLNHTFENNFQSYWLNFQQFRTWNHRYKHSLQFLHNAIHNRSLPYYKLCVRVLQRIKSNTLQHINFGVIPQYLLKKYFMNGINDQSINIDHQFLRNQQAYLQNKSTQISIVQLIIQLLGKYYQMGVKLSQFQMLIMKQQPLKQNINLFTVRRIFNSQHQVVMGSQLRRIMEYNYHKNNHLQNDKKLVQILINLEQQQIHDHSSINHQQELQRPFTQQSIIQKPNTQHSIAQKFYTNKSQNNQQQLKPENQIIAYGRNYQINNIPIQKKQNPHNNKIIQIKNRQNIIENLSNTSQNKLNNSQQINNKSNQIEQINLLLNNIIGINKNSIWTLWMDSIMVIPLSKFPYMISINTHQTYKLRLTNSQDIAYEGVLRASCSQQIPSKIFFYNQSGKQMAYLSTIIPHREELLEVSIHQKKNITVMPTHRQIHNSQELIVCDDEEQRAQTQRIRITLHTVHPNNNYHFEIIPQKYPQSLHSMQHPILTTLIIQNSPRYTLKCPLVPNCQQITIHNYLHSHTYTLLHQITQQILIQFQITINNYYGQQHIPLAKKVILCNILHLHSLLPLPSSTYKLILQQQNNNLQFNQIKLNQNTRCLNWGEQGFSFYVQPTSSSYQIRISQQQPKTHTNKLICQFFFKIQFHHQIGIYRHQGYLLSIYNNNSFRLNLQLYQINYNDIFHRNTFGQNKLQPLFDIFKSINKNIINKNIQEFKQENINQIIRKSMKITRINYNILMQLIANKNHQENQLKFMEFISNKQQLIQCKCKIRELYQLFQQYDTFDIEQNGIISQQKAKIVHQLIFKDQQIDLNKCRIKCLLQNSLIDCSRNIHDYDKSIDYLHLLWRMRRSFTDNFFNQVIDVKDRKQQQLKNIKEWEFQNYFKISLIKFYNLRVRNQPATLLFKFNQQSINEPIPRCYSHNFNQPYPSLYLKTNKITLSIYNKQYCLSKASLQWQEIKMDELVINFNRSSSIHEVDSLGGKLFFTIQHCTNQQYQQQRHKQIQQISNYRQLQDETKHKLNEKKQYQNTNNRTQRIKNVLFSNDKKDYDKFDLNYQSSDDQ